MIKSKKTPIEIEAHEAEKLQKRMYKSTCTKAKRRMIELCREKGLATGEMQLDYAKRSNTALPSSLLSREATIEWYEAGINEYKQSLTEV